MGVAVGLDLERLMALPLDPVARATLCRELLMLVAAEGADSGRERLRESLERWLLEDELARCRRLGQEGAWLEALQRLEALLPLLGRLHAADAPEVLLELLMAVHQATVIEEDSLAGEERSELLWQALRWLRRDGAVALPSHDWVPVIREQIFCAGAIAWLDRVRCLDDPDSRAEALRRAHALLLDLTAWMDPCPDWVAPHLREGLRGACDEADRLFHPLAERVAWAQALAHLAPEQTERERLNGLLGPALAALEVGRALRLPAFSAPSGGR